MLSVEFEKWGQQGARAWLCVDGRRMIDIGCGSHFDLVQRGVVIGLNELAESVKTQEAPHA